MGKSDWLRTAREQNARKSSAGGVESKTRKRHGDGDANGVNGLGRTASVDRIDGLPYPAIAGVATGPVEIKRGRPRIGETRDKPWIAAGMSRRTWYRRKAEKKASKCIG